MVNPALYTLILVVEVAQSNHFKSLGGSKLSC